MSTLAEMIEALQKEWQRIPTNHHLRPQDIRDWCERERTNSQLDCAKALTPLLAAAREQSRDLTEAVASRNSWKEQWKLRCEMLFKQVDITEKLEQELAAMKEENSDLSLQVKHYHDARMPEQHDADLREVAELASLAGKTYGQQSERYMNGEVGEQPDWPTPDSIVRGFREQKAKVRK